MTTTHTIDATTRDAIRSAHEGMPAVKCCPCGATYSEADWLALPRVDGLARLWRYCSCGRYAHWLIG